jgi:hypothetical protein
VDLQASVADALKLLLLPPTMWTPLPIGHVQLTPAQAARMARIGVQRGWPDILVFHVCCYGIELKRRGGKLSKTRTVRTRRGSLRVLEGQEDVFPRLLDAGIAEIATCDSLEGVLAALQTWGIPLRRWR